MIERRVKVLLAVSSLVASGLVAAVTPAVAQRQGGGGQTVGGNVSGENRASNTLANLLIPAAALAYGAYWLTVGLRYHWIQIPHRVGHPYAITPKPTTREEPAIPEEGEEEKGEP